MSKEDFDVFWRTHLVTSSQGCNLSELTVLYWHAAKEETSSFPWTRREGSSRSHATAAAARDLLTQVRVATRKNVLTVTLIQNYSPCSRCVEEILKSVALASEKRIKLEISIAFVALNGIRRPSWTWRAMENAIHGFTVNESNDNSFALRRLQEAGVKLSTFNPDTWRFLYTFLGNGMPFGSQGKFLGGKYSHVESRLEEDKLMETDLIQVLRGISVTSSSTGPTNTSLNIEWDRPKLAGEKVSEYRIVCKKVTIKNKEDEERLWRILQTVDKIGVKVSVSGELTSCQVTGLDLDTFYDVTTEAVVKGIVASTGRKLFRTGNKAPIPSLQTPTPARKLSSSARPRTSSASSYNPIPSLGTPTRLKRSNSIQSSTRDSQPIYESNSQPKSTADIDVLQRSISKDRSFDSESKSSRLSQNLFRSSSIRSTLDKAIPNSVDSRRKTPDSSRTSSKDTKSNSASDRKNINNSNVCNTAL